LYGTIAPSVTSEGDYFTRSWQLRWGLKVLKALKSRIFTNLYYRNRCSIRLELAPGKRRWTAALTTHMLTSSTTRGRNRSFLDKIVVDSEKAGDGKIWETSPGRFVSVGIRPTIAVENRIDKIKILR
jgi:hypothetical protein